MGWELGEPRQILVEFVEQGFIEKGKALDLCCGAGTNTVYLAKQGFKATGMDVSSAAIKYAKAKAQQEQVQLNLGLHSFIWLPFQSGVFDFVFDMGCFHHVEPSDRSQFIEEVTRVLRKDAIFMLTCFSYKNGDAWNHFTKKQLQGFFSEYFSFEQVRHYPSVEGDGYTRFFFTILMKKK